MGWESDTNKFKIGDGTNHWANLDYFSDNNSTINPSFGTSIVFEGATADSYETTLQVTDPTGDRTITLPDVTGTIITTGNLSDITDIGVFTSTIVMEGSTANDFELTLSAGDPTADRTITFPDATGTVATQEYVDSAVSGAEVVQSALAGSGLTWNAANEQFDVNTSTIQARVADVSDTEIGYLNGVTSAIQTQLDDKSTASKTETFTNKTLTSPKINEDVALTATATELNYVDGVTSAVQTQLNNKLALAGGTMTGAIAMGTSKITGLGTPTDSADAVTKAYVDALSEGLHIHASVVAATTANITLATDVENGDVLDGVTLATGNRILVKNQSTASENGIYVVAASGAPSRATDFDTPGEIDGGDFVFVTGGTVNDNRGFVQINLVGTIGTDPIEFSQFSGAGTFVAGNGLTLTDNSFSINTSITADLSTAQTLTNKTINGSNNTISNVAIDSAVSGLGSGIATFLGTPSSANLISAITDETGTGSLVFGTAPTITNALAITPILRAPEERWAVSATAATGTIPLDILTSGILYYTSNASANWTLNVRGSSGVTLNDSLAINDSITVVFFVTNGGTPYYQTGFQIDGSSVTPKWQNGSAPAAGNANSIDIYSYTIVKTGNAAFTAFGSQTRFA
jgi:hypothetical protein